jgi:hypothetical protein
MMIMLVLEPVVAGVVIVMGLIVMPMLIVVFRNL